MTDKDLPDPAYLRNVVWSYYVGTTCPLCGKLITVEDANRDNVTSWRDLDATTPGVAHEDCVLRAQEAPCP